MPVREIVFERHLAARDRIRELRTECRLGIKGAPDLAETRASAASLEVEPLDAQPDDEPVAGVERVSDLPEERGVPGVIVGPEPAQVLRVLVGVDAVFLRPGRVRADRPAIDPPGGTAGVRIESELLAEHRAVAPEVAKALIRGCGPVVVVAVGRVDPRDAGHGRKAQSRPPRPRATQARGQRRLFIAAGLVAEGTTTVVVEGEVVEAAVEVREEQRSLPAPGRGRIPLQSQPRVQFIAGVGGAVERDVVPESVAQAAVHGQAGHELRRSTRIQRTTDGEPAGAQSVAACRRLDEAGPEGRGRGADQADEPARRVGAERAGLRAAQHLDLLHIERAAERTEAREVEVVEQEADGRVRGFALVLGILADPADLQVPGARRSAREGEVGNLADQITEVPHGTGAQGRFVVDADAR